MNAEEKAREVVNKLKAEVNEKKEKEEKGLAEVKNSLAMLKDNTELAKLYTENANLGSSNLAGELPLLKVHAMGKSTKNDLADGSEPNDGWFFYKPNHEQFQSVICHILTVSKGFRAEGMEGKEDVFNQIVGGVIVDGTDYKPFIMYFTGMKLQYLWEFGKQASQYTKARPVPIPMFALYVQLTTEKKSHDYGKSWMVNLTIVRNEDSTPRIVTDPGEFVYLKDNVSTIEDTITSLIQAKTVRAEIEDQAINGEAVTPAEEVTPF